MPNPTPTRSCVTCGKTFKGASRLCQLCRDTERTCRGCGRTFKGTNRFCQACQATDRTCEGCGDNFRGHTLLCQPCRATDRICGSCGEAFKGKELCCSRCRWKSLPIEVRRAKAASKSEARRALELAAKAVGSVPQKVYEAIRASGPCVYCGQPAKTVDHIRPLGRGGWDHEDNLVPACKFCNRSKGTKFLTEWRRSGLVAHGVEHSVKVAAEYARLSSEAA